MREHPDVVPILAALTAAAEYDHSISGGIVNAGGGSSGNRRSTGGGKLSPGLRESGMRQQYNGYERDNSSNCLEL
jgi:hypothetical protein